MTRILTLMLAALTMTFFASLVRGHMTTINATWAEDAARHYDMTVEH